MKRFYGVMEESLSKNEEGDSFTCPECLYEFVERDADVIVRSMNFNKGDDAIQATSLVYCPNCGSVVLAVFDSLAVGSNLD